MAFVCKQTAVLVVCIKRGFHETTKINQIDHRCMNISRQVIQTCRHQLMDCRLELLFHHWSAGELISLVKSIVLCTDEINKKIALKLSKT